jgi:hypothetical protein
LGHLKKQTKAVAPIDFDGEALNIRYRVHAFTPNVEAELRASEKEGSVSDSLVRMLTLLLDSWDLNDEKGKVLPVNETVLRDVPLAVLSRIFTAISEDQAPPPEKSGSSFD